MYKISFLVDKFKGKYRLKAPYDISTNTFPRDLKGNYSEHDIYVDCLNGIKIFYFGCRGVLEAYIPSLGKGRNIIKAIYSDFVKPIEESEYFSTIQRKNKQDELISINSYNYDTLYKDSKLNEIINTIIETDEEVLFRFKYDKMELLEKYLKPKTNAPKRSPFSTKNLPKRTYNIPDEELKPYKEIVSKIPPERILSISHTTDNFIKSLATKKTSLDDIKADMKLKCLKGKEYIHYIGKWNEYIKYLNTELNHE